MNRRRSVYLIAGVSVVMLAGMFAVTRPRSVLRDRIARPAGPSAIDEGAENGVPGSGLGVRHPTGLEPRTPNTKPRPGTKARRPIGPPVRAITNGASAQQETREKPAPRTAATSPRNPADSHISGDWGRSISRPEASTPPAGDGNVAPPLPADQPAPSILAQPVLTPPLLRTVPSLADGSGMYHVVLERENLAPQLKAQLLEGRVVLRMLVHADGSVDRAEVARSSGQPGLDEAAVTAALSWKFDPATRDGIPIDAWVLIPVRFVIR